MSIRRTEPNREYSGLAGMEGRLHTKLEMGEPLDAEERTYLATLRGAKDVRSAQRQTRQ